MHEILVTYIGDDTEDTYADTEKWDFIPQIGGTVHNAADGTWWIVTNVVHIVRQRHGDGQPEPSVAVTLASGQCTPGVVLTRARTRDGS